MTVRRLATRGRSAAVFLLFLVVAAGLQYLSGAHASEFSGYFDEPAHYVTGLMVREYLASGIPESPLEFAETYYLHYPKVAIGQWPPFFYLLQAPWTLLFSPARTSVLLFMAVLSSLWAFTVFRAAKSEFGSAGAVLAGLLLLALPLNQISTSRIMAEIPVALLSLLAALAFGRYLDTQRWPPAAAFGIFAALAILTKGTALSLALLPPIAVALAGRVRLLATPSFWLPVAIVIVLCGPWYALTARDVLDTFGYQPGWTYTSKAIGFFALHTARAVGPILLVVLCAGAVVSLAPVLRGRMVPGRWAALAALALSVYLFHSVVSAEYDNRYLVPLTGSLVLFLASGIAWLGSRAPLPAWPVHLRRAAAAVACGGIFLVSTFNIPQKIPSGFRAAADSILLNPTLRNAPILVSSKLAHSDGEGMLIAEIAMREHQPRRFILRGTKALTRTNWNGTWDEPFYTNPADLMKYLDEIPIGVLVVDTGPNPAKFRHHDLVLQTVAAYPARFDRLAVHPGPRDRSGQQTAILVYRVIGNENPPSDRLHLDRARLLSRRVTLTGGE